MQRYLFNKKIKIILIIIAQVTICILIATQKKTFFCDETYSYGLANSEKYTFIDPETANQYSETGWVDQSYFKNYVCVSKEAPFSFKAAYENQKKDVHPPFYYCIFHIFSLLDNGMFSKWIGLALNFFILILIDLLFLNISDYLLKNLRLSLISLLFWTFSAAGLSNILFIRMYLMLTCEMLAFVAVHIKILKIRKAGFVDILNILLLVVCGGLTHYYFYLFVVCFSAPVGIYLLLKKEIKKITLYGITICAGVGGAFCIFPSSYIHIFHGYRGTEVMNNLANRREDGVVKAYLELINNSLFAGKFKICLVLLILLLAFSTILKCFLNIEYIFDKEIRTVTIKFIRKQNIRYGEIQFVLKDELMVEALLLLSYSIFALVAIRGSEIVHNRYIYPIYPIVALMVIVIINKLTKFMRSDKQTVVISTIAICLCIGSLLKYRVDFMYTDYDTILQQAQEVVGTDCLLYYGDGWLDVYTSFPLRFLHNETYFLRPDEMGSVAEILSRRSTEDRLTVCLSWRYSEEDTRNILDRIISQTGAQGYRRVYSYDSLQEWIIETG